MKTLNLLFLLCLIVLNVSAQNVETKIKALRFTKTVRWWKEQES